MLEIILERYNFPIHKKKLNNFNAYSESINEFCGDRVEVFLRIENNRILEIGYDGKCCTICQGVIEILIDELINKDIEYVKNFKIENLIDTNIIKVRTKCSLIGLETIKKAIYEYERNS